jgi:hypothetical protein
MHHPTGSFQLATDPDSAVPSCVARAAIAMAP